MKKLYAAMHISEEALFTQMGWRDSRFDRKAIRHSTPPTEDAWERYKAAKAGLEALEAYEGTEWGGPDYGTTVEEPEPTITYEYLESHEEWLSRCRELSNIRA